MQKYRLDGANALAMFAGGGLALAEDWPKQPDGNGFHLPEEAGGYSLDLTGLSCRWQPLGSLNGVMLTLVGREQGWIVPPGNPKNLTGWSDAVNPTTAL